MTPLRGARIFAAITTLFHNHTHRWTLIRRCFIAAACLILCAFPDVIFFRANLSGATLVNVTMSAPPERVQLLPEREGREAYHGYFDSGGAAFQSEPSAEFVRRSFQNGQSIYWNPYSATGSYGPETLVDIKTSPITLLCAVLGGGDLTAHVVFLTICFFAVFSLLLFFTVELRLSFLAALAGAVTYLLNGYFIANLGSNVAQVWLYFPMTVLALTSFARRPTAIKLIAITASAALLLATTFLPTMILTLGTSLVVGFAAALGRAAAHRERPLAVFVATAQLVAGQISGIMLALLALAVLYLPVMEALKYMSTGDFYAARIFFPAKFFDFISFFTPKHAFETYNAITERAAGLRGNAAFHQGIIGSLLATQAIRSWPTQQRAVLIAATGVLLVVIARIYGVPGISQLIDHLPVAGSLGEQYLWITVGLLFSIVVAFGTHGLLLFGLRPVPLVACAVATGIALIYTTYTYGFANVAFKPYIWVTVFIILAGVALIYLRALGISAVAVTVCLIVASWSELTFYVDHYRLVRVDRFSNAPQFVKFLQTQGGVYRVASYGSWGIPPEYGSAYGLYQIESMNFQLFPRYVDVFNRLILPNPAHRWTSFVTLIRAPDVDSINLDAYDFLGAKSLIVPASFQRLRSFMDNSGWALVYRDPYFRIYENPKPLPRAFMVRRLVEGNSTPLDLKVPAAEAAVSDDPTLINEAAASGITASARPSSGESDVVSITRYDHTKIEISASVVQSGVLVLNDAWHPNWKVRVDGSDRYLGRVNEAFRGVVLPPGQHIIEMSYTPRSLGLARNLSLLALMIAVTMLLFRRQIDRRFERILSLQ